MEIHKKFLLILTIILASIILYRLWLKRIKIKQEPEQDLKQESFANIAVNQFVNTNTVTTKLNQYFIKASWNTAYTSSNTIDLSMVENVVRHGCRFLDFEIYSVTDTKKNMKNQPVVGYSIQPGNHMQTESKNTIPLTDVIDTIIELNNKLSYRSDPLFIQLRVKSEIVDLYKNLITLLKTIQGKNLTIFSINSEPLLNLSDYKNKIVLIADLVNSNDMFTNILIPGKVVDNTNTNYTNLKNDYKSYFINYTVSDFASPGINSVSNSSTLKLPIRPPVINSSSSSPVTVKFQNCLTCVSSVTQFTQSYPDFSIFNLNNPSYNEILTFVMDYGINILPIRYYIDDNGLADYDNIFDKYGFIAISEILLKNNNRSTVKSVK